MFSGLVNSVKGALGWGDLEVVSSGETDATVKDSTSEQDKQSLWKQLSGYIGKDVTSMISLPVWLFEPLSFLQILVEPMQYAELLFRASDAPDPVNRLAYLTTWIVAGYSCAVRTKKPFNPFLGETFEFVSPDKRFRIFGEQVSHHPPISALTIEAEGHFTIVLEMELHTKFRGNSTDVLVHGSNMITFHKFNETIAWGHMQTTANNVIIGGMWLDHFGELTIESPSGAQAVLKMTQSGWLGAGRYDLNADITDAKGKLRLKLNGKWNDVINATKYSDDGVAAEPFVLWKKPTKRPENRWGYLPFVEQLNWFDEEYKKTLPPGDSRLRSDRLALEKENLDLAGKEKYRLEEEQRALRRERETKGETWEPRYFKRVDDARFEHRYEYVGKYWEEREERIKAVTGVEEAAQGISALSTDA